MNDNGECFFLWRSPGEPQQDRARRRQAARRGTVVVAIERPCVCAWSFGEVWTALETPRSSSSHRRTRSTEAAIARWRVGSYGRCSASLQPRTLPYEPQPSHAPRGRRARTAGDEMLAANVSLTSVSIAANALTGFSAASPTGGQLQLGGVEKLEEVRASVTSRCVAFRHGHRMTLRRSARTECDGTWCVIDHWRDRRESGVEKLEEGGGARRPYVTFPRIPLSKNLEDVM